MDAFYIQPEYVVVAKSLDEDAERIELPAEQDGSLGIQTLAGAFPGAHGLKYKNLATGAFRALLYFLHILLFWIFQEF